MDDFVSVLMHPLARLVAALLVMALVQTLKEWRDRTAPPVEGSSWLKRALYAVLVSPLGRMLVALVVSLPTVAAAWAGGASLEEVLGLLATTWGGAMVANTVHGVFANAKARDLPEPPA